MAYKKYKTEHGHRKDMAGKSWEGRKIEKEDSRTARRLNDKTIIREELMWNDTDRKRGGK